MKREKQIQRKTRETDIGLNLNLDGEGQSNVDTGIPFMDHMSAKNDFFGIKLPSL